MIALIDYGAGNLHSVQHALDYIGCESCITSDAKVLMEADAAILPGVGSFGHAMECLQNANLVQPVLDFIHSGKPFLGICLGLQLLFEESEESPGVKGLGVFQGKIQLIPGGWDLKVPHIGWNSMDIKQNDGLFQNIAPEPYVYFVHSYYLKAEDEGIVTATTEYSTHIHASVEQGNVFACQFHPEKSSDIGIQILKNFVEL